jgi:hypothetical protein
VYYALAAFHGLRAFAQKLYNRVTMLKSFRRVLGLALLGVMFATAVPVFAAPQTGKKGAKKGGKKGKGKAGKTGKGSGKSL